MTMGLSSEEEALPWHSTSNPEAMLAWMGHTQTSSDCENFLTMCPVEVTVDLYINLHIHVCLYQYTALRVPHTSPYFTHSHRAALCSTDAYLGPNFPFIDHKIL